MWHTLDPIWQECFALAWDAYCHQTIPIGAVVVNDAGAIVSRGRNRIFETESNDILAGTQMAHAEVTAMSVLKDRDHDNLNGYTLYSTMEPCPMCFSTMVIMGIRNLKYAAKDGWAGATELNDKMAYIQNKKLSISKTEEVLEVYQIALQTAFEYERCQMKENRVVRTWREHCPDGVALGEKLLAENYLKEAVSLKLPVAQVFNEVVTRWGASKESL